MINTDLTDGVWFSKFSTVVVDDVLDSNLITNFFFVFIFFCFLVLIMGYVAFGPLVACGVTAMGPLRIKYPLFFF